MKQEACQVDGWRMGGGVDKVKTLERQESKQTMNHMQTFSLGINV